MRDVGIDGQIEYIDPSGNATGRIVGVQVKSGASYFERRIEGAILFTPEERHRDYWREFPLPVILVLCEPGEGRCFWVDARAQLRDGAEVISVPVSQELDGTGVLAALAAEGPLPQIPQSPAALVAFMLSNYESPAPCALSFFDLFVQGLTDHPGWSVYFGMDLYVGIAEAKNELYETVTGVAIGTESFAFLDRYVAFLVAFDLARVDFDSWRSLAERFQLVGRILAPLTARGLGLVAHINELDEELLDDQVSRVIRDRPVAILLLEQHERTARIERLKRRLANRD